MTRNCSFFVVLCTFRYRYGLMANEDEYKSPGVDARSLNIRFQFVSSAELSVLRRNTNKIAYY